MNKINIIGAGLAGSEAALVLSRAGIKVKLYEMRPNKNTEVHKTDYAAELVCSNSFKSLKANTAAGMLKAELEALKSPVYQVAIENKVDAGMALAVDREKFAKKITKLIEEDSNIELIREEVTKLEDNTIVATGPLTSQSLCDELIKITGEDNLSFYDAAAPIVESQSINYDEVFYQDRYDKTGDYLNCPLNKEQYYDFIEKLIKAECVIKKDFETKELFQACQPIEEIAKSGKDAPRFGCMKPIGIINPKDNSRPYAVVQLRAENASKTAYNLVGFQTNLKFNEQKSIFRLISGLENAEFSRYGVMHKNIFLNAPKLLDKRLRLKDTHIYIAGQLSGTEGYLEAVRSGHHVALSVLGKDAPSSDTVFGALLEYATNPETKHYQPMHVNFGILPKIDIRNKKERYEAYAKRGKIAIDNYVKDL